MDQEYEAGWTYNVTMSNNDNFVTFQEDVVATSQEDAISQMKHTLFEYGVNDKISVLGARRVIRWC